MITTADHVRKPENVAPAPKRPSTPRWDQHKIYGSVALAAPSTRLVLVEGWADQGETGHTIHDVIAISSVLTSEYARARRPGDPPADSSASPERLEEAGWRLEWTGTTIDAVVVDPESGELCEARFAFDSVNAAYRIVAAAWDPSEDSVHLASTIAQVERLALKRWSESGYWDASVDTAAAGAGAEVGP